MKVTDIHRVANGRVKCSTEDCTSMFNWKIKGKVKGRNHSVILCDSCYSKLRTGEVKL